MSRKDRLRQLLKNPRIWRAGTRAAGSGHVLPTGFTGLDRALSGGWPAGVLIELFVDAYGVGELEVLMPALGTLSNGHNSGQPGAGKWIMWASPPYTPYAPALKRHGINIARLLLIRSQSHTDVLWAMEQSLQSGTCAAVFGWTSAVDERDLRRLQLAAEEKNCWVVLFRPARFRQQRSPAALRIHLQASRSGRIRLGIFKNYGGRPETVELMRNVGLRTPQSHLWKSLS